MGELWSLLFGVDRLGDGQVESVSIQWTRLHTPFHTLLLILAGLAGLYGIWWFYRREPEFCSRVRKVLLASLRGLGLAVLLVVLAGPALEITRTGLARNKVAVLLDVSKSMSRQDKYVRDGDRLVAAHLLGLLPLAETDLRKLRAGDEERVRNADRLELVKGLLTHPQLDFLAGLRERYDVELLTFSRAEPAPLGARGRVSEEELRALRAEGPATDLGGALEAAAEKFKGQPLAGIVLITDGGNNRGEEPALVAERIPARVFPIGIGVPEARDVAVEHLFVESRVFLDDPAPLYVRIKNRGYGDEQHQLLITLDGQEVARQAVTLRKSGEQIELVRVNPKKAGKCVLRAEIPAAEGDSEPGNNFKERPLEVIDKKIKVLVLESAPRWEHRYLTRALLRDKRVECRILLRVPDLPRLAVPGSPFIKEFPKKEELLAYDVVVFGNLPNDAFWTEQELELLRRFVTAEGGGLWFIAGRNHFPDGYKDSRLELLLPVEFERNPEVTAEDERQRPLTDGFRLALTPEGRLHALTRLDSPSGARSAAEFSALWDLMPDLYWFHKASRAKTGATVLLVHGGRRGHAEPSREGPAPLLLTMQVGRGRVLYSAVDEFWRMRFPLELGPDALDRFYGHAIQYLGLAKALGGAPRIEINTDREEYAAGDPVQVTARVLNRDTFDPSTAPRVPAVAADLQNEARTWPFDLAPVPGQPGMFRGQFVPRDLGVLRLTLLEADRRENEQAARLITVRIPQVELDTPEMNWELLEQIAKASVRGRDDREARALLGDQAGEVLGLLRASQRRLPPARLEDSLWDAPIWLLLFTLFLGSEWLIRKRSDLC